MKENRAMRGESARPGKRPTRSWTIAKKIEAIDRVHEGVHEEILVYRSQLFADGASPSQKSDRKFLNS